MNSLINAVSQQEKNERRRHPRYHLPEGGIALLTVTGPYSTVVGHILDISISGLSFRYVADEPISDGPSKITIALPDSKYYLRELPIEPVSDFEIAKIPFGSISPRRHSIKFGRLTDGQRDQLEHFIRRHAV